MLRSLLCVALACLAACGWNTRLALGEAYGSVGIEVFRNDSYLFDLERDLHRELSRSVSNLVQAPQLAPARADLVLRGKVVDYHRRGGLRSRSNRLLESAVIIRVEAALWDRHTGEIVAGPVPESAMIGYTLDAPGTELEARQRALQLLARQIVLDLFGKLPSSVEEP